MLLRSSQPVGFGSVRLETYASAPKGGYRLVVNGIHLHPSWGAEKIGSLSEDRQTCYIPFSFIRESRRVGEDRIPFYRLELRHMPSISAAKLKIFFTLFREAKTFSTDYTEVSQKLSDYFSERKEAAKSVIHSTDGRIAQYKRNWQKVVSDHKAQLAKYKQDWQKIVSGYTADLKRYQAEKNEYASELKVYEDDTQFKLAF